MNSRDTRLAREIWEPTEAERAEHEARHAQALAEHRSAHPEWYLTDEELMS